jgi:hypothetical protein
MKGSTMHARPRIRTALNRRVHRLRDEPETGAQVAEYAMLGGVSAAACTALWVWLKQPGTIERIFGGVVDGLSRVIGSWF